MEIEYRMCGCQIDAETEEVLTRCDRHTNAVLNMELHLAWDEFKRAVSRVFFHHHEPRE